MEWIFIVFLVIAVVRNHVLYQGLKEWAADNAGYNAHYVLGGHYIHEKLARQRHWEKMEERITRRMDNYDRVNLMLGITEVKAKDAARKELQGADRVSTAGSSLEHLWSMVEARRRAEANFGPFCPGKKAKR